MVKVFVTVGTYPYPFQRLVDGAAKLPTDWDVVVQWGHAEGGGLKGAPFLDFPTQLQHMKDADVVVTTGGETVTEILLLGKMPVIVPRKESEGEHVNDHQVAFAHYMAERGWAIRGDNNLQEAIERAAKSLPEKKAREGNLKTAIRNWLEDDS